MTILRLRSAHVLAMLAVLATHAWSAETVTLTPSSATPALGASFTVTVNLAGAAPFANWATYLAWDPTRLQLTAQSAGGFSTFIADSRSLATINGEGAVHAGGFAFSDNAGGSNSLGVFTFTTLASGATTITTSAKSGGNLFGMVLVDAAATERIPALPGPLTITVGAGATAPELDVTRSGAVADGGTDTVSGSIAGAASVLTYTLANSGTASLSITGVTTVSSLVNCTASVTTQPAASVAASASTSLVVSVTPTAAGAWSVALSTPNSDGNENPYNWTVSGSAAAPAGPELDVTCSGAAVADGGTSSIAGSAAGTPLAITYVMANHGSTSLSITGATTVSSLVNCTASVTTQPAASVAASASTSLVVSVTPTATGAWSFALSTPNDDSDENPYNWTVSGAVGGSGGPISVSGGGGGGSGCGAGGLAGLILAFCLMVRLRKGR